MLKTILTVFALFIVIDAVDAAGTFEDGWKSYIQRDFTAALTVWKPLADAGDHRAMALLSHMYDKGYGVQRDAKKSAEYGRKHDVQAVEDIKNDYIMKYHQLPSDTLRQVRQLFAWDPNDAHESPPSVPQENFACRLVKVSGVACADGRDVFTVEASVDADQLLADNPVRCNRDYQYGNQRLVDCRGCMVLSNHTVVKQGLFEAHHMISITLIDTHGMDFGLWTRDDNVTCVGN